MTAKINYDKNNYQTRIVDSLLEKQLKVMGAVLVYGPRYCGKTWTSSHLAKSSISLQGTKELIENNQFFDSEEITKGQSPRLIDEWQEYPYSWERVITKINETGKPGQFILTGSFQPVVKKPKHSGSGRIGRLKMYPMSLSEMNISSKQISLSKLINENKFEQVKVKKPFDTFELAQIIIKGGWPNNYKSSDELAKIWIKNYVDSLMTWNISHFKDNRINYNKYSMFLKSLARNEGQTCKKTTIAKDIMEYENENINIKTINNYFKTAESLYLIENQTYFKPNFLSSNYVLNSEKIRFIDPSIPAGILKLSPQLLNETKNTLGVYFESLVIRDLRIYSQLIDVEVLFYRNKWGQEVDCILKTEQGDYAAIEIKLGSMQEAGAIENLRKFRDSMIQEASLAKNEREKQYKKVPKWLIVISGTGDKSYVTKDNIYVIPFKCLYE